MAKRVKRKSNYLYYFISVVILLGVLLNSNLINILNEQLNEANQTKVVYKNNDSDIVPDEDKSNLTEKELEKDFENLTAKDDSNNGNIKETENGILKVHYIDVGQGDSIFIELPNKEAMLIDAGEASKGKTVAEYITSLGYKKIDYLIGTHPHTDHIGGLAHIINSFDITKIYMPKVVSTSKTYENLLNTIALKNLKITTARAGVNIVSCDDLTVDIISPTKESYSNLNSYSVVTKIKYGDRKFLFMGEAEVQSENEILTDVSSDVIKVGHHGSDTSSSETFVNKVKPKYAIIMVGSNNRYKHPYQSTLDRWHNIGAEIYRTDLNGNIIVTSDGSSLDIKTSK